MLVLPDACRNEATAHVVMVVSLSYDFVTPPLRELCGHHKEIVPRPGR